MKQRVGAQINELFGFGKKKKRTYYVGIFLPGYHGEYDEELTTVSKTVRSHLQHNSKVKSVKHRTGKQLYGIFPHAITSPYEGYEFVCAESDFSAVKRQVENTALMAPSLHYKSKQAYDAYGIDKILLWHTGKVVESLDAQELQLTAKSNVWEALDELYEDMPQPVDYKGMPEAQLIKIAYDLGKQSSELVDKIRYHQAAQGPSYWSQRGALQKAQRDFDTLAEQYDAVEAQLVRRGLDIWSTVNRRQISIVVVGVDANDVVRLSQKLTIYKYCVDESGKLVNLLTRPSYQLPPIIDNLCIPYLVASTEAAHPGATCKLVPTQLVQKSCYTYERKTKMLATYTMADMLSQEVAALLPAGYTGVVYLGSGANTLSSEPEFSEGVHLEYGLFKRNATLEGQVGRRPVRQFTEFAYLVNNAVAPKASTPFDVDIREVRVAARAAQIRQHNQWQAEYNQQRRLARNAKARERRAALKAQASAAADDAVVQ